MSGANNDHEYVPSDEENNGKKKVFSSQVYTYIFQFQLNHGESKLAQTKMGNKSTLLTYAESNRRWNKKEFWS